MKFKRVAPGILFDECDRAEIEKWSWSIDSVGYAAGQPGRLHRFLLGEIPEGMVVDHLNQNKLDNRRQNLRVVPHYVNLHNCGPNRRSRTGVRGVYYVVREPRRRNRYEARIRVAGKRYLLGRYVTLEEAATVIAAARAQLVPEACNG